MPEADRWYRPPGRKNRRQMGFQYEQEAATFLKRQGYQILKHNYYCRHGEIDLIAKEDSYLVFIEVKYRKTGSYGFAAEAVTLAKQRTIRTCAQIYMKQYGIPFSQPVRFDVLAIDGTDFTLIKHAFGGL